MEQKPRVAVIGLGDYFQKIHSGIAKWFEIAATLDKGDYRDEAGALADQLSSARLDAVMVLAPNRTHASLIVELASLKLPVFVEKPLVTTAHDLDRVLDSIAVNPALYCSDFYPDVSAVPLLRWFGRHRPTLIDQFIELDRESEIEWGGAATVLGEIRAVSAKLLEGTGPKASFQGRDWLWDPIHGGMLWDLAYHDIALWFALFDDPLSVESVRTRSVGDMTDEPRAETYADVQLRSESGVDFSVEVGKYIESGDNACFEIVGSKGTASLRFASTYPLTVNGRPSAHLTGSFAEHVVGAFREFVDSGPTAPHGLEIAKRTCGLIVEIRKHI